MDARYNNQPYPKLADDCTAAEITNKLARNSSRQKCSRRKNDEMPHVDWRLLADKGRRFFTVDDRVASWLSSAWLAEGLFRLDCEWAVTNVAARRGPDCTEQAGCDCQTFGEAH